MGINRVSRLLFVLLRQLSVHNRVAAESSSSQQPIQNVQVNVHPLTSKPRPRGPTAAQARFRHGASTSRARATQRDCALQLGREQGVRPRQHFGRDLCEGNDPKPFHRPSRPDVRDPAARLSQGSQKIHATGLQLPEDTLIGGDDEITGDPTLRIQAVCEEQLPVAIGADKLSIELEANALRASKVRFEQGVPLDPLVSPPGVMSMSTGELDLSVLGGQISLHDVWPECSPWIALPQESKHPADIVQSPKSQEPTVPITAVRWGCGVRQQACDS